MDYHINHAECKGMTAKDAMVVGLQNQNNKLIKINKQLSNQ